MIRITLFPHFIPDPKDSPNPYISDFVAALNQSREAKVVNEACRSTLLSLLKPRNQGDVFIFNWFESIPDAKHWLLHTVVALFLVIGLKMRGKRIVWVLHNKESHATVRRRLKMFMAWFIARTSTFIITHAQEGVELVKRQFPFAARKVHFLHHPTKDRLTDTLCNGEKKYDLLIWGNISRYKGVIEFTRFLKEHPEFHLDVCIAGRCISRNLQEEIAILSPRNVIFRPQSLSYDELRTYIAASRFVLVPYNPASVLSSGVLMDSLSFGAKVIGPAVGSFRDYAAEPLLKVYTFRDFREIPDLVRRYGEEPVPPADYHTFLKAHDWPHFAKQLIDLVNTKQ